MSSISSSEYGGSMLAMYFSSPRKKSARSCARQKKSTRSCSERPFSRRLNSSRSFTPTSIRPQNSPQPTRASLEARRSQAVPHEPLEERALVHARCLGGLRHVTFRVGDELAHAV